MTKNEKLTLWVERNRKAITEEEFSSATGTSFAAFSELYPKDTRAAWRSYIGKKKEIEEPTISVAREKHLLKVIAIWRRRYMELKRSVTAHH